MLYGDLLRLAAVIRRRQIHGRRQIADSALGNCVSHCGHIFHSCSNCADVYLVQIESDIMRLIRTRECLVRVTVRAVYTGCCVSRVSSGLSAKMLRQ